MTDVRSFADLGVDEAVITALAEAGIERPFPIQELSLPMALSGADLIGQARTGTGKTLAFGIPLVQRVDPAAGYTQALVIVPTRELCLQVHDDLAMAGSKRGVQVVAAYGGRAIDPQSEAIAAGAPIVVGTPGRLLDLVRRGLLDLSRVTMLVLDEADEMLDMGFLPDVEQLIERCASDRQTLLFSATMPSEVVRLARRYMDKPTFMRSDVQQQSVAPQMRQLFFACHRLDKPAVVARILASPSRGRTLIFTRTKRMADVLAGELRERGIDAGVIHSDLRQEARERALARFRKGTQDVLCATEVAARGLDIEQVTHVINYDCPDDERMYLHRIGRTGRAGATGVAVTLAVWNELARLDMIKRALDIDEETHEVFSTSPLLDKLFGPLPDPATQTRRSADEETAAAGEPERERAGANQRPAGEPARGRSGRRSRRTRRRRRRTVGQQERVAAEAVEPSAQEPQATAPEEERDRRTDGETAPAEQPADASSDARPAEPSADSDERDAQPSADAEGGQDAASGRESRRPEPAGARAARGRTATRGNGAKGPSGGRRRSGGRGRGDQPVAEPVSPAGRSARGAGRPAPHRPLHITYLP